MFVVIVIIIVAILFPGLSSLRAYAKTTSGEIAVSAAVIAARALSTRDRQGRFINIASLGDGRYSGVAMLFTPANEIRLVENNPYAVKAGVGFLELVGANDSLNGYTDIPDRDYVRLPQDVGAVGVSRDGTLAAPVLKLLMPPFAVRFDQNGHLVVGFTQLLTAGSGGNRGFIYYNGNYDNSFDTDVGRGNPYASPNPAFVSTDPRAWDPVYSPVPVDSGSGAHFLPFERIESVIGVMLFTKSEFYKIAGSGAIGIELILPDSKDDSQLRSGSREESLGNWILENGKPLFFSRQSGVTMREGDLE